MGKEDELSPPDYHASQKEQVFLICDSVLDDNRKVFTSEGSLRKYKENKRLGHSDPAFKIAKNEQNNSIGLPLMFCKRRFDVGFGEVSYLSIYACKSSPEASDRLYDKADNELMAEVFKEKFMGYYRYRLKFSNEEYMVYLHSRLPIVDFNIGNDKFRFVKAPFKLRRADYVSYDLFLLSSKQSSLTDDLGPDKRVNKRNELLGSQLQNMFPIKMSSTDRSSFVSSVKLGTFEFKKTQVSFSRTRKTSTFSLSVDPTTNLDRNDDVSFRSRIYLAVVLILQAYQDDLAAEGSSTSGGQIFNIFG